MKRIDGGPDILSTVDLAIQMMTQVQSGTLSERALSEHPREGTRPRKKLFQLVQCPPVTSRATYSPSPPRRPLDLRRCPSDLLCGLKPLDPPPMALSRASRSPSAGHSSPAAMAKTRSPSLRSFFPTIQPVRGEISPFRLRGMLRETRDRYGPQSAYPGQGEGELLPGYGYLGQLKDNVSGMANDPAAHLYQLDLQAP